MPELFLHFERITAKEAGQRFLDYYSKLGYQEIPGSPLLDDSVPMSFVMSAGMVQFEKMSETSRGNDHFVLIQNSFRYFDLEQVGNSNTHLSLFQMPGAFDFGPVDRQKTISQIWRLLTCVYGLDPNLLCATYFSGDTVDGEILPADLETASAWHMVGLPIEHVIGLPAKYNFWRQTRDAVGRRASRKRGPNTEVFFDRGIKYACGVGCFPGCPCGRYIEFLNTLFITHGLNEENGCLQPLVEPFTEVVIGLERVALILQGVTSVFEIDSVYPLIQQVRCFSKPLSIDLKGVERNKLEQIIVDHLRALLFLVTDGAPPPGKGGRARLMRILIREFLTCQRLLGISDRGFMRSMVQMAIGRYPQVASAQKQLLAYITIEARRFEQTVQYGLSDLEIKLINRKPLGHEDILAMEKEHGLPLQLSRYLIWKKSRAIDPINSIMQVVP